MNNPTNQFLVPINIYLDTKNIKIGQFKAKLPTSVVVPLELILIEALRFCTVTSHIDIFPLL